MTVFKNILFIIKNYKDYLTNKFIKRIGICGAPMFIVGCDHSGTSLLLTILGSHSNIYAVPFESKITYKSNKQKYFNQFNRLAIAMGRHTIYINLEQNCLRIYMYILCRLA